jgi:PAS domain S-box-containing protein
MPGVDDEAANEPGELWPSLARFVRHHEREVQTAWLERAKRRPAVREISDSALWAGTSPLLRWLGEQVGPPSSASLESLTDELAGARPVELGDDSEVVAQLSISRDCLLRAWRAAAIPEQALAGTIIIDRVIDTCVTAVVERYVKTGRRAMEAIENVSLASFESSTLDELLQRLLEALRQATEAVDGAVILLVEGDHLRPHAVTGVDLPSEETVRIGEGFAGRIAAEKRSLSVRSVADDPLILNPRIKTSGMRAAYGAPLLEGGSVIGVAAVTSRTVWEFSKADRALFDIIARRAAMKISLARVREVLDRERAYVEALVAQMPAGVVLAEAPSGKLTMHNPQVELIWRRPFIASDSVEQYGAWPGYHLDGRRVAAHEWPLARAISHGEIVLNEEIEILRGDGSRGAILLGAAPIRGPNAQIIGGVATFVDITDKRRTEHELKRAAEQAQHAEAFQAIASEASQQLAEAFEKGTTLSSIARMGLPRIADWCAVHELSDDGMLQLVSVSHANPLKAEQFRDRFPAMGEVGGLTREVLEDQQPRIFPRVTEDMLRDWAVNQEQFELLREFGVTSLIILPLVHHGRLLGIIRYGCAESGRTFSPADLTVAEELARRAATALDNARLYRAAQASEAKFAGLVSIASDAIISIDSEQRIVIFNAGAEAIFGWKQDEVVGRPLDVLIPERLVERHRQHVREFAAGSVTARKMGQRHAISGRRKDGSEFPADAAISKLELDGKPLFTVVLRDITEQKRLEREQQAAIELRDNVMGTVAHDLRNPLSTILMLTSLLKQRGGEPSGSSQRRAEAIERATSRMDRLVGDLLDVSRMDGGQLTVDPEHISAVQVISESLETEKALLASASLELDLEIAPNLPGIRADRHRFAQILENLIGNAAKFTRPGGRITVGAMPDNREVLFWIKDTGIGIAAEHLPHLFDRFWQVSRDNGHRGLGLGLSIVKGLVEAHGGRVWVESTPGEGTTVFFTLPAAPPGADLHAEHEPPGP